MHTPVLHERATRRVGIRISDFSASEEETSDEDEQAAEEAREERRKPLLSEIMMPSWENVVYDRAEWAAMLGRIDIQAQ